jgi:DUF2884 family protein
MKTLLATVLLLSSSTLFAHDLDNSCNINLHAGIQISPHSIQFFKQGSRQQQSKDQAIYKIVNDNRLFIGATERDLSASQQALVHDYATSIRNVIPEVNSVAIEGIDLASEGVTLALNELLGNDNDVAKDLTDELAKVRAEVNLRFNSEQTMYFDEDGFAGDEFFDEKFEDHIEAVVENAIKKSMGSILIAVGQQMLFANDDGNDFETRMEKFGEQMEQKMELKAASIEKRANGLCQSMAKIDRLEELLKIEMPALAEFNLLSVEHNDEERQLSE